MNKLVALACLAVLTPGPLAFSDVLSHWPFDEEKGVIAMDSVGGIDGTLTGGATFAPSSGMAGGAVSLDRATNDFVTFGDVYPFTGGVNRTVSVWTRTSETVPNTIPIGRHTGGSLNGYFLFLNTTACYGSVGKASGYFSAGCGQEPISLTTVTDDEWHHLTMTFDASSVVTIFVDGIAEDVGQAPEVIPNTASLLVGGVFTGGEPVGLFTGLVDDVQIYDHAATEMQVLSIFEHPGQTLPPCPADLSKDGAVAFGDLLILLTAWGCMDCPEDINGDGEAGFGDILTLLSAWGECPVVE